MIRVSDHALLRFLERDIGLDIEGLRLDLETSLDRVHRAALSIGVSDYAIRADGNTYIVRRSTVTTVIPDDRLSLVARFRALAPHGRSEG